MRHLRLLSFLAVIVFVVAACGGGEANTTSSIVGPTTSIRATTTTVTNTTTTTIPPTTTTSTIPPTPEELRSDFLASLDSAGWVSYTDSIVGWSIRYPSDWEVVIEEPGETFALAVAGGGLVLVSTAQDALDDNSSADYFEKNVQFSVDDGLLRTPGDSDWFWLDHDFDGTEGPLDIAGVQTSWAVDITTGETYPEDVVAPTWQLGYYNPDLRPDYGYIFQTIGTNPLIFELADTFVLSFEPPKA